MSSHRRLLLRAATALLIFASVQAAPQDRQIVSVQIASPASGSSSAVPMSSVPLNGTGIIVGQVIDATTLQGVPGAIVTLGGALPSSPVQSLSTYQAVLNPSSGPVIINNNSPGLPRVIADSDGRFAFRSLPHGTFNITATKAGFLDGAAGRVRPNGSPQSIELGDGDRAGEIKIRLFRGAAITGTLLDDLGEPVVSVQVKAYRRTLASGRRVLTAVAGSATTDDRGVYRLANLLPGEYVVGVQMVQSSVPSSMQMDGLYLSDLMSTVVASGKDSIAISNSGVPLQTSSKFLLQPSNGFVATDPRGRTMAYPTQFYPAAGVVSQAAPIVLASGEERAGIDLSLKLVPTFNISGRLLAPDGPAVSYALHLVPADSGDLSIDPDAATAITDANGEFQFLAIPPGQYVIQTVRSRSLAPAGERTIFITRTVDSVSGRVGSDPVPAAQAVPPTLWTTTPVAVANSDITDLQLMLRTGRNVSGKIEFDGAAQRPSPDQIGTISVTAESADGKQQLANLTVRVDNTGQFTMPGLLPGKYILRATTPPGGWTLKGASVGGMDATDAAFDVEDRDITGVTITFFDRPSGLQGTVRVNDSANATDTSATVVVFPADARAWTSYGLNPRRLRSTRAAARTGAFSFSALPAGDYYVVAISDEFAAEWQDPLFLDQLSRVASRVSLSEGQKVSQELTIQTVRPVRVPDPDERLQSTDEHGPFVSEEVYPQQTEGQPQKPPPAQSRDPKPQTQTPARDTRTTPTAGTGSLSGTVMLDDGSPQPIRRGRVTARSADGHTERIGATDDAGRFTVTGLPPGHYTLMVTKPAYLSAYYGATRPGRGPGTPIALTAGQSLANLTLKMTKGGVIAGMVRDEYGLPVSGAAVRLMQFRTVNGERTLASQQNAITDDRGMYRAFGLQPAAYVVCATPPPNLASQNEIRQLSNTDLQSAFSEVQRGQTAAVAAPSGNIVAGGVAPDQPAGRTVGFSPVCYPNTPVQADASTVAVGAGQEVNGIDIAIRLVATARIDGTLSGPDGRPAFLASLVLSDADMSVTGAGNAMKFTSADQNGKFSFTNVPPGHYTITARGGPTNAARVSDFIVMAPAGLSGAGAPPPPPPPPPPPGSSTLYASMDVDVNGQNVSDIPMMLQEGMTLSGRIVFAGKALAPPANITRTRVVLSPVAQSAAVSGVPSATIDENGTFRLVGIPPGKYRLSSTVPGVAAVNSRGAGAAASWALRSAIVDGRDVLDTVLEIRPGQNLQGLTITFTDQPTEISGTLLDAANKPTPGFSIVVFSTDRSTWLTGSRRISPPIQVSTDGRYRVTGLPPGEYYLAALTDYETGDLSDRAFLEQVAAVAMRLTIGEGEKKTQDLKISGGS